ATDPELEEAAIRFANGDDAGAESGLINALASSAESPDVALSWAAALLDLYRATSNQTRFEWAVAEYAVLWTDSIPRWAALSDIQDAGITTARSTLTANTASAALSESDATWSCPPVLTVQGMEDLREAMSGSPPPWHLGWGRLKQIGPDAMPLLGGLFSSLCDEPVSLRFSGADRLVSALRDVAPSGDRSVDASWWAVRLNALRTMQLHDEFELLALDYCITYEVSPPAWEPARCHYENAVGGSGASKQPSGAYMAAPTAPMALDAVSPSDVELQGDVLGDATPALASLQERHVPGDQIVVSCRGLVRVDFSAAGSILNWVAMRQAEGSQVQFRDVHRL
ncbi:MAG: STAS domain-containing protein, partial [Burkholderiaceae bacterium]